MRLAKHNGAGRLVSGLARLTLPFTLLVSAARATPPSPAVETARRELNGTGLRIQSYVSERDANRAQKAGLTEAKVLRLLRPIVAPCLARDDACKDFEPLGDRQAPTRKVADTLAGLLGELGSSQSLPMLDRMDARSWVAATMARRKISDRAFEVYRKGRVCPVPTAAEVRQERAGLDHFVVVQRRSFAAPTPEAVRAAHPSLLGGRNRSGA